MGMFIDGIGSSQALDTAGEVVDIQGLDCSSLEGSVFNFEHKSDLPAQIVGKILKCKKIFSEEDCEDDRQAYYWSRFQIPFLYVMGELLDGYKDSAKEVAGMFLYDADNRGKGNDILGFSVEGAKIKKEGSVISRSIARKITITNMPCNKTCIAEMIPSEEGKKDDLDSIFKTEEQVEIELKKSEDLSSKLSNLLEKNETMESSAAALGLDPIVKAEGAPKLGLAPKAPSSSKIGTTASGKAVLSHGHVSEYTGFSSQDHRDAATAHHKMATSATSPAAGKHHFDKFKMHSSAAQTLSDKKSRLGKAMEAGSSIGAAPSELTQGAALQAESIALANPGKSKGWVLLEQKKKKRKEWLAKAQAAYSQWDKKEAFVDFMQKTLPGLTRGEIDALGQTIALKKSLSSTPKAPSHLSEDSKHSVGTLKSGKKFGLHFEHPENANLDSADHAELAQHHGSLSNKYATAARTGEMHGMKRGWSRQKTWRQNRDWHAKQSALHEEKSKK